MKKVTALLTAAILLLNLSACQGKDETKDTAGAETTQAVMETVTYFHGDDTAERILSETAEISQCTPQALMDLLSDKGVLPEKVTVRSCQTEDDVLTLDLSREFAQAAQSLGTAGEYVLMGSVVNTFLTAFEADSMYILVEGKVLSTGHDVYDYPLNFYYE